MSEQVKTNVEELEPLLVRHEAPLGWLILNRPQVRNALNLRTWQLIVKGVAELDADPDVRVIIMRGATPEAFISGADISEFPSLRANAEQARIYREAPGNATSALINCPKPVIAMIAGICIGGGVQVALACDIRIGARGTRLGVPAARLGLAYPLDGVMSLVQVCGPANARDILMSARIFDAEEAYAMGLLNKLVEPAELEKVLSSFALEGAQHVAFDEVETFSGAALNKALTASEVKLRILGKTETPSVPWRAVITASALHDPQGGRLRA